MRSRLIVCIAALCLAQIGLAQGDKTHTYLGLGAAPDEAAAKRGEPLFKQNCAACHGENARGGEGPDLTRSPLVLHDQKGQSVAQVLKNGRPENGMPAFPNLKPDEVYDIAEYLHWQIEKAANRGMYDSLYASKMQIHGDAAQGKQFFDSHCTSCHSATGDLAKIGDKYTEATAMQARFIWPRSHDPRKATVVTKTGETLSGTLVHIDDFDVTLRDASGGVHEWPRDQVQVKIDDKLAGHRALLPQYTDADLHNLTAYLLTLK